MTRSLPALRLVLLSGLLVPAAAVAGPSSVPIAIEDRGDHVAILLAGGHTSAERPQSRSDRLEIALDRALPAVELKLEDATVRKVELVAQPPSLRIQLRHGTDSTRLSAEMAELRQDVDNLEIVIPREPRDVVRARAAAAAAPRAATQASSEAAPPQPAAAAAPPPPAARPIAAAPAPAPAARPIAAAPAPAPAVPAAGPTETAVAAPLPVRAQPALDLDPDRSRGGSRSPLGTAVTFGALAGLAAAGWLWLRRKRAGVGLGSPLEILAQVSVGPRARVVWLSAGRREMLISVSEKDVRVLGQWLADGAHGARAESSAGLAPEEAGEPRLGRLPGARLRTSPSLSGLLRLRDQHASIENGDNARSPGDEDSGEEPDTEWARQLVAATRRGALR